MACLAVSSTARAQTSSPVSSRAGNIDPIPPPAIGLIGDKRALDELINHPLTAVILNRLQSQMSEAVRSALVANEVEKNGAPRRINDRVDIQPLKDFFDQWVNPVTGDEISFEGRPPAGMAITRMDFYLQRIRQSLTELSTPEDPTRKGDLRWIDDSIANWKIILEELRESVVEVYYRIEITPQFEGIDLETSTRDEYQNSVSQEGDVLRGAGQIRMRPRVKVDSVVAFFRTSEGVYPLPSVPNYDRVWQFDEVRGWTEFGIQFEIQKADPFSASFSSIRTNIQEVRDEAGNVVQPGVRVAETDVNHLMQNIFTVPKYRNILSQFYAPKIVPVMDAEGNPVFEPMKDASGAEVLDENGAPVLVQAFREFTPEDARNRTSFRELPIFHKVRRQVESDSKNVLSATRIPIVVSLEVNQNGEIEPRTEVKTPEVEARLKRLAQESPPRLVALLEGEMPLKADDVRISFRLEPNNEASILEFDLPPTLPLVWRIRDLRFPKSLFSNVQDPLVQQIISSFPESNLSGPDAVARVEIELPSTENVSDLRVEIPFGFDKPSQIEALRLNAQFQEFLAGGGPSANGSTPPMTLREFEARLKELEGKAENELPIAYIRAIGRNAITQELSGAVQVESPALQNARLGRVELNMQPDLKPVVIDPRLRDFEGKPTILDQLYAQVPEIVDQAMVTVPKEVLENLETSIADQLKQKIGELNVNLNTPDLSAQVSVPKFELSRKSVDIAWDGEMVPTQNLQRIDHRTLPSPYQYLYTLASHEETTTNKVFTRIRLPKEIRIRLDNLQTKDASISFLEFSLISQEDPIVEVEWKIVRDAAGQLQLLPVQWNVPEVLQAYSLDEKTLTYGNVTPRGFARNLDAAADTAESVGIIRSISPWIAQLGVQGILDFVNPGGAVNDSVAQGARSATGYVADSIVADAVQMKLEDGAGVYRQIERGQVVSQVRESVSDQISGLAPILLEQMFKATNGEFLAELGPVHSSNGEAKGAQEPRNLSAPLPALQREFESQVNGLLDQFPIERSLGRIFVGDDEQSLANRILRASRQQIADAVEGRGGDSVPAEITNSEIQRIQTEIIHPSARDQASRILMTGENPALAALNLARTLQDESEKAVNEVFNTTLQSVPQPNLGSTFEINLPTQYCRGPHEEDSSIISIFGFMEGSGPQNNPKLLEENPLPPNVAERSDYLLYGQLPPDVQRDLSSVVQTMTNEQMGYDSNYRRPPFVAAVNLDYVTNHLILPNLKQLEEMAIAAARANGGSHVNDSFQLKVSNLRLRTAPTPEEIRGFPGETQLLAEFELDISQKGTGLLGFLGLTDIDLKEVDRVKVEWPLNFSIREDRPQTSAQRFMPAFEIETARPGMIRVTPNRYGRVSPGTWIVLSEPGKFFGVDKGVLLRTLADFRQRIPIPGGLGLPMAEEFVDIQILDPKPVQVPGQSGYVLLPVRLRVDDEAVAAAPRDRSLEVHTQVGQKVLPYLQTRRFYDFNPLWQGIPLPETTSPNSGFHLKIENENLQWVIDQDGTFDPKIEKDDLGNQTSTPRKQGKLYALLPISGSERTSSGIQLPPGRFTLRVPVENLISHDRNAATLVLDPGTPQIVGDRNGLNEATLRYLEALEEWDAKSVDFARFVGEERRNISLRFDTNR